MYVELCGMFGFAWFGVWVLFELRVGRGWVLGLVVFGFVLMMFRLRVALGRGVVFGDCCVCLGFEVVGFG